MRNAVAVFLALALAAPPILACEDCWPVYNETMIARPFNWITAGYEEGDVVWVHTTFGPGGVEYYSRWYVYSKWDYPASNTQPACCWDTWYVGSNGQLFQVYPRVLDEPVL